MIWTLIFTACTFGYSRTACVHEQHDYPTEQVCLTAAKTAYDDWKAINGDGGNSPVRETCQRSK